MLRSGNHNSLRLCLRDCGLMPYAQAYALQLSLVEERRTIEDSIDTLLLVEHPDVYTFGRKSGELLPPGLPAVAIERGGEATYHNPGQLVAYPILKLEGTERDLHRYLRDLEEVLIQTLAEFDLPSERRAGATGVWVRGGTKKIASLGVAVRSWVTYHGIALNVQNDLSGFSKIHPCGFTADVMTSLRAELGDTAPSLEEVKQVFVEKFKSVFSRG